VEAYYRRRSRFIARALKMMERAGIPMVFIACGLAYYFQHHAKTPNVATPTTDPSAVVAPPKSPPIDDDGAAERLKKEGLEACAEKRWADCMNKLYKAREAHGALVDDPAVRTALEQANRELSAELDMKKAPGK
jgi:hypothetical protein